MASGNTELSVRVSDQEKIQGSADANAALLKQISKGVNGLTTQVETLVARIHGLETSIANLESRVGNVEKRLASRESFPQFPASVRPLRQLALTQVDSVSQPTRIKMGYQG